MFMLSLAVMHFRESHIIDARIRRLDIIFFADAAWYSLRAGASVYNCFRYFSLFSRRICRRHFTDRAIIKQLWR